MATKVGRLKDLIRDIPDFPRPGVAFKDITPLLADAVAFEEVVEALSRPWVGAGIDKVLGVEARGFLVAAPVALRLGAGFVPARKGGKLPWQVERQEYALEYGTDLLEIHRDGIAPGETALIIDDVLATGGTAEASIKLVERLGGRAAGLGFVIELGFLGGRLRLGDRPVTSLLSYE